MKLRFIFICMALCAMMMGCENPNSGTNPKVGFIDKVPLTDMEQSELDAIFTEANRFLYHKYVTTPQIWENTVNIIGSRDELYDLVAPEVRIGDLKSIDFSKHCIVYGVVPTGSSGNTFSKAELYMKADGEATFLTTINRISINCEMGCVFPYAVFDIPKKDIQQITIQEEYSTKTTEPYEDEIELAIQIAQLVEGENYNDVLTLLDKIVVKDNYSMKIVPYYDKDTFDMFADTSPIVIYNEQGEWLSTNFEDDFWNYLQVENSQMGAWQAYLLSQMWHYLPLQWHANYSYRDYIYSQSSKSYDILREHFIAGKHQVAPQITQEGDKFLISACYWSEFEGLVREHYAVTFENDRVYVEELDANILYEYDCGIQF